MTDIYRKANHTDQYLLWWTYNHPVHQQLGIIRMLMHHAETLIKHECSLEELWLPSVYLEGRGTAEKRQKRREEEVDGHGCKDKQEKPKKVLQC